MASITNSKTLFFTTSPRTPYKIIDEIKLLVENFTGKPWNVDTQKEFATLLSKSDFFEGHIKDKNVRQVLAEVNKDASMLKVIGSYPKASLK